MNYPRQQFHFKLYYLDNKLRNVQ